MNEIPLLINKNNNMALTALRRRMSLLALLPVVLLQLWIAFHQFDHVTGYAEDTCPVCVQLDRVDAAVDQAADRAALPLVHILWAQSPSVSISRDVLRNFNSRAPPRL